MMLWIKDFWKNVKNVCINQILNSSDIFYDISKVLDFFVQKALSMLSFDRILFLYSRSCSQHLDKMIHHLHTTMVDIEKHLEDHHPHQVLVQAVTAKNHLPL